ncbi:MAG: nuclear transport factor 2 family protein [Mycobacteriaceae bacterium]|nr:nuclear transport factor 2 family protein [Mycobacteriaceae bacterium]
MTLDIADRLGLSDLVHRYAAGTDDRRFDEVLELFVSDATLWLPEPPRSLQPTALHRGHPEIATAIRAVTAAQRTQHAIVGEVYVAAADGAHGRVSCIAHHWSRRDDALRAGAQDPGEIVDVVWHLRYDDSYVRTAAGWRFRARTLTIDAIETRQARRLRPQVP